MEAVGNAAANAYFEAAIPARYTMPKDGDTVRLWERFIRDKYEHKKFVVPGSALGSAAPTKQAAPVPAVESKPSAKPAVAIAPVQKAVAAPALSLLDFDSPPVPTPAPQRAAASDGFGDFNSTPATTAATTTTSTSSDFGDFGAFTTSEPKVSRVNTVFAGSTVLLIHSG
jgi:hypothetical protein